MSAPLKLDKNLKALLLGLTKYDFNSHIEINDLVLDSRQLKSGDVYFAIQGSRSHGLDFLTDIQKTKPAAIVYQPSQKYSEFNVDGVVCIPVEELNQHVSLIASRYYSNPSNKLKVTAITGTNGKTTCAYLLAQLLESQNINTAIIGTIGSGCLGSLKESKLTTPDAINLQALLFEFVNAGIEHVVMEASSHALHQCRLDAVEVDVAAMTNLSQDHLDYHLDMQNYFAAKAKLFTFDSLHTVVVNADDQRAESFLKIANKTANLLTYSALGKEANLQAADVSVSANETNFVLKLNGASLKLECSLLGRFNVANLLLALSVMQAYGNDAFDLSKAVARLTPPSGRLERIGSSGTPTVVIDYAHTPDALDKALSTLKDLSNDDIAAVFGCGGDRDKAKRPVMGAIASQLAQRIYLTDDNPRTENSAQILSEIQLGISEDADCQVIPNRAQAIKLSIAEAKREDIVLIAGKGHEDYQIIGHEKIAFSDHLHAQAALDVWQENCS